MTTFRRSRKKSAPLLQLSKVVKSTLGVVPHSIHETLFPSRDRMRHLLHSLSATHEDEEESTSSTSSSEDENGYGAYYRELLHEQQRGWELADAEGLEQITMTYASTSEEEPLPRVVPLRRPRKGSVSLRSMLNDLSAVSVESMLASLEGW